MMKVSRSNSVSSEEAPSSPESIIDASPQPSPSPHTDSSFEDDQSQYSPAYRPDDHDDKYSHYDFQQSPQPININYEVDDDTFGCQDDFVRAVQKGNHRDLKHILSRYSQLVQINRLTADGQTPLTQSCLDGNLEVVKVLVDHGANPELTNRDGFSPFHVACFVGRMDLIKYFLSANNRR